MKLQIKVLTVAALLGFASLIGYRKVSRSCATPVASGHSHGGDAESQPAEGFGTRVCEAGFLAALQEKLGFASAPAEQKAAAKDDHGHSHGDKESDGHAYGDAADSHDKEPDGHEHGEGESEGLVKLTQAQISAAGIETAPAGPATLVKEISVPGRVALNGDRQAKIVPKIAGIVASINKQLGAHVEDGEVLAAIESREVADAKSQYLEAWRAEELAKKVFEREERLWQQKVTAEQDYLTAKNAFETSKIQLELAHQKLHTMGLDEADIDAVIASPELEQAFRSYKIRSPIKGRVTARNLVLGQMLATDTEIFNIADLSTVWVDLAVQPADLPFASEGQEVIVRGEGRTAEGKIVGLSPVIDPETRSARAIAEIDNSKGEWQPGDYVRAQLISSRKETPLSVPRDAIQTINGKPSVFVSQQGGFKARAVTTGKEDSRNVEIISGLNPGDVIAVTNTFALKAELGKSEAEHEH